MKSNLTITEQKHKNWSIRVFALVLSVLALAMLAACASAQSADSSQQPLAQATATNPATVDQAAPAAVSPAAQAAPSATATIAAAVTSVSRQAQATNTAEATAQPVEASTAQAAAPACTTPAALTPAETEGPYFKAGSPERSSLITTGVTGQQLVLTGYVMTADCKPVAHALLDFWQANANGQYDNSGYTLRGHLYTDANGRYQLTTIVPGLYPGRTEHIHVKVQAPNGPVLTTQLYFPGVTSNQRDGIFDPQMLIDITDTGNVLKGTFNFIVSG